MKTIAVTFRCNPFRPLNEILVARLAEHGFESFEELEPKLLAYAPEANFDEVALISLTEELAALGEILFEFEKIPDQNWNAEWEKSYPPVTIENRCIIRAPFHEVDTKAYDLDIVINPQMSFGTGHHETTWLVLSLLLQMDVTGKSVLDMGSGSGVLAIAVAKRNAGRVVAIDNEDWAYRNTLENCALNNVDIPVQKADTIPGDWPPFDIILANINKNVLLKLMPSFSQKIKSGGDLILSGFFETDAGEIAEAVGTNGFKPIARKTRNSWVAMKCIKL